MEYKSFSFSLDDVSSDGSFQGYAATFGNVDLGYDVVEKGAFKNSLFETNGGKIPILDHHNPDKQIGWNLKAFEDKHGLFVQGQLDLNVQIARERHSLMRMAAKIGVETGLSIGFRALVDAQDARDPKIRKLKEIQLLEYSIVTFPMNTQAKVIGVKKQHNFIDSLVELSKTIRA